MARLTFGGTIRDTVARRVRLIGHNVDDYGAATLTAWSAATGGTRYTDLLVGGVAATTVPVAADGQIPEFKGPDGIAALWVSTATGATRVKLLAAEGPGDIDLAVAGEIGDTASATRAALDTGVADQVDDMTSATSAALTAVYARIRGNSFIPAGDSLSSFAFNDNVPNWAKVAAAASNGRATVIRSAGVSGNTSAQLLARLQADVIAYAPALVTVLIGTNDVPATPSATFKANVAAIHDALRAAGIASVVCTIPPRNDGGAPYLATIATWNAWLRKFAYDTNRPLFDFHAQVADKATGALAAAYTAVAAPFIGVHLTAPGNAVLGEYVAAQLPSLLPPFQTLRPTSNTDPINLVSNGLLLNSSGGIPTGYTPSGGATGVVETIITNDADFHGNAWEWVFDGTDTPFRQLQTLLTGTPVAGHTIRLQCRIKVISETALGQGDGVSLPIVFDGASSGAVQYIIQGIQGATGLWVADFVVPAGTTGIYFQPAAVASTGQTLTARLGELAAFDLTALSLA